MTTNTEGTRMTETPDNVPAIRTASAEVEVARPEVDSWIQAFEPVIRLASHIADTEFVPRGLRGSAPATAAAMLYGREVGLQPMTALSLTHVVEGKPAINAEGMRALVLSAGHDLQVTEASGAVVRMRGRRRGSDHWTELAWNMDMARAAGVAGKGVWQKWPRAMLLARCTTDLCRMIFPDVIHGFRSVEELEDLDAADVTAAEPTARATTTVKRTRKTAATRKAVEAPKAARPPADDDESGPPLPGEDGFDELDQRDTRPEPARGEPDSEGPRNGPAPTAPSDPEPAAPSEPDEQTTEAPTEAPAEPDVERDTSDRRPVTAAQRRMVMATWSKLGLSGDDDRDERLYMTGIILGREVESTSKITRAEASKLIDTLAMVDDRAKLNALLDGIEADRRAEQSPEPVDEPEATS